MSSTACLLSKSDVDWWGRAASRPRLQKRFPNAHPLSSPDPLRGGRKYTAPAGGNENGFRTPVPPPLQIHWLGGGAKRHSPCRRRRKRFPNARLLSAAPWGHGAMSPTMPVPTPIQMSQGGGELSPPSSDIGNGFRCLSQGGELSPPRLSTDMVC